jgi:Ca2+-binding EF-hand superfamily protein
MIPNTIKETDIDFLTKREKEKCVEMFNCFDKNGSKLLEKQELIIALQGKSQP